MNFRHLKSLTAACLMSAQVVCATPFAFVCNSSTNTVSVIDVATHSLLGNPISISPGIDPVAIAITPDSTKAYVCNNGSDTISVIDTASGSVTSTISVGVLPKSVSFTPDGSKAFVCNSGANSVSIINVSTNSVLAVETVGTTPVAVAVSPDGTKAYVCNSGDNTVSIIDVGTNTVLGTTIAVGTTPEAVAFAPNGTKAYVCNYGGSSVSDINVSTDTVSNTIAGVDHPTSIVFTLDSSEALVTNAINNTVTCILTATDTIIVTPGVGSTPSAIALTPDGSKAYVGNVGDNTISIIDLPSNGVEPNTISVNPEPYGIAMSLIAPPPPPVDVLQPKKFLGEIVRVNPSCLRKAILTMKWTASPTVGVDTYQIFKRHKIIASIPATAPREFRVDLSSKQLRKKKLSKKWVHHLEREYRIRAVANGVFSPYTYLKIKFVVDENPLLSPASIIDKREKPAS